MPYLPTAQSWLHQSTLLLQARPTTTRITTKYTIEPTHPAPSRQAPHPPNDAPAPTPTSTSTPTPPKAHLTLKTYDPASGVCLKYRTDKAAEVGRLIAALGRCGRVMAALPARAEVEETGAPGEKMGREGEGTRGSTPVGDGVGAAVKGEKGKGGGGKKKKGRK